MLPAEHWEKLTSYFILLHSGGTTAHVITITRYLTSIILHMQSGCGWNQMARTTSNHVTTYHVIHEMAYYVKYCFLKECEFTKFF